MGFLGKSPESKSTKKTGRTLAILSLATKTWWKDKDEQPQEKTEWHRIIVWNGLAEYAADKLKKGDHLYVVGTLVSSVYEKEVGNLYLTGLWKGCPSSVREKARFHSSRNRIAGSIESARCAGIQVATNPSRPIANTAPANTKGSRGVA